MPDIGHVAVGMLAGRLYSDRKTERAMIAFSAISLLPDLDMISRAAGLADGSALGHRGATHSLLFAMLAGSAAYLASRPLKLPARRTALFAGLVAASHGALDMLDAGQLGVAYLWPLSPELFFWPWRPLPGPPPGEVWLSLAGARVIVLGALPFLPIFFLALWPKTERAERRLRTR